MKVNYLICILFAILATIGTSFAEDNVTLTGRLTFASDLKPSYMKENFGHTFIKTIPNGTYTTGLFGVKTDIEIRNGKNEIVGLVVPDDDGSFTVSVQSSDFYIVEFTFLNKKHKKTLSKESLTPLIYDFGRINSKFF